MDSRHSPMITASKNKPSVSAGAPPTGAVPSTKSRRGRKRITDPVLAVEIKRHRRTRANDRERTRMRLLNEELEHLRLILPVDYSSSSCYPSTDTSSGSAAGAMVEDKLTKIETLRTATEYIRLLTNLLGDNNGISPSNPTNLHSYMMPDEQASHQMCYEPAYSYYNHHHHHHHYC